jgi:hypothetical protein
MGSQIDYQNMRKELEAVFKDHGIGPPAMPGSELSLEELRRVRDVATHIVDGNIDREEISKLGKKLFDELPATVQSLISLQGTAKLRELQEINPYYTVFHPKIIQDGIGKREG